MEDTLKYSIPQSVIELAELIKSKFTAKEQLKLVKILQTEPEEDEHEEPTKEQLLQEIREAVEEVKLARQGKIKLKTLEQLLDEL
jgi:aspartyl aminopeptidase